MRPRKPSPQLNESVFNKSKARTLVYYVWNFG